MCLCWGGGRLQDRNRLDCSAIGRDERENWSLRNSVSESHQLHHLEVFGLNIFSHRLTSGARQNAEGGLFHLAIIKLQPATKTMLCKPHLCITFLSHVCILSVQIICNIFIIFPHHVFCDFSIFCCCPKCYVLYWNYNRFCCCNKAISRKGS